MRGPRQRWAEGRFNKLGRRESKAWRAYEALRRSSAASPEAVSKAYEKYHTAKRAADKADRKLTRARAKKRKKKRET